MIPFQFKKSGYVKPVAQPQAEKTRAFGAAEIGATPPSFATDITPFKEVQNIFMQNQEPSCVAHGVTWAIMYHYWKKTGKYVLLSPRFIYALCKTVDGLPADSGTYIATALQIAKEYGVCEDSYFTNDTTLDVNTYTNASLISAEAKANALKYRIDDYQALADLSTIAINAAIYNGGQGDVVITGMDIGDTWWTDTNGVTTWSADSLLPLRPIDAQHPEVSGHCTDLYAFGEEWDSQNLSEWWGMNWWSAEWAYQGRYCYGTNDLPNLYEAYTLTANFDPTSPAPPAPAPVAKESLLDEIEQLF